ncbi:MAG: hypothetical protein ABI594_16345 [Ginsengibacter sp.]
MLEIQVIELLKIEPTELDSLLALGWFRMQQTIFTTDILHFYGQVYNAVWLRADLQNFYPDKKYKTLRNRNSRFKTEIKKAIITPAHEVLFSFYKENILFEAAPSLHALLYDNSSSDVYNTFVINMYDENKLIGSGFFDLGGTSAAGICSIYDPGYKKYSLGKYMIYEKMLYCKSKNFQYFYPGYFVPGYALFDYKLEIGTAALEYFDANNKQWITLFKHARDV